VSKAIVVETQKQHVGVGFIQSFDACITTTRVETIVAPNIDVIRRGVLIGFAAKLGRKLGEIFAIRNWSRNLTLPTAITRIVGIHQMVFTNLIMTIHVNRTI